jgi:hypothetical protein
MDEIISYKMCAVNVRNAKLRNYLKSTFTFTEICTAEVISVIRNLKTSKSTIAVRG